MKKIIKPDFFNRPTLAVAEDLLGKHLAKQNGEKAFGNMITEVEAYDGPDDKASHAHKGITPRNKVMFGPAGFWYVYLVYGMHWMLNIVTGSDGYPAAVLIRGLKSVSGPARLTRFLNVEKSFCGKPAVKETGLWIEDRGVIVPKSKIKKTPRIGVDYAGCVWSRKLYRFVFLR